MIIVRAEYTLPATSCLLHLSYTINAKGEMLVGQQLEADSTQKGEALPCFGMRWLLPADYDSIEYYGRGRMADSPWTGIYHDTAGKPSSPDSHQRNIPMVTDPIKPILDPCVISGLIHAYVSQSDRGEIVIGAMRVAGSIMLASVVDEFASSYPNANIRVLIGSPREMMRSLRCGDVGQPDQIQRDAGQPADLPPQPRRLLQMLPRRVQPSSAMIGDAEMAQVL